MRDAEIRSDPSKEAGTQGKSGQDATVEPSGVKGDNPATAGQGQTNVKSATPKKKAGKLNPSAPEDANVSPGSAAPK